MAKLKQSLNSLGQQGPDSGRSYKGMIFHDAPVVENEVQR